jgi:hypothetical protein
MTNVTNINAHKPLPAEIAVGMLIEFARGIEAAIRGLEVLDRDERVGVAALIDAHIGRLEAIRDHITPNSK